MRVCQFHHPGLKAKASTESRTRISTLARSRFSRYTMDAKIRVTGLEPASVLVGNQAFCQLNYTRLKIELVDTKVVGFDPTYHTTDQAPVYCDPVCLTYLSYQFYQVGSGIRTHVYGFADRRITTLPYRRKGNRPDSNRHCKVHNLVC